VSCMIRCELDTLCPRLNCELVVRFFCADWHSSTLRLNSVIRSARVLEN
jgi:hypothetical protein